MVDYLQLEKETKENLVNLLLFQHFVVDQRMQNPERLLLGHHLWQQISFALKSVQVCAPKKSQTGLGECGLLGPQNTAQTMVLASMFQSSDKQQ